MNLRLIKTLLYLSFILVLVPNVKAQQASGMPFLFSVSPTSPSAIPLPTTNLTPLPINVDEWDTLVAPAGWTFSFSGVTYSRIVISSNGWLALIPGAPAVNPLPYPANSLPNNLLSNNTTGFPIIAPLWDDHSTSLVTYNVTGNVLAVRWYVKWQKTNVAAVTSLFFAELNGNNGTIAFHYFNNAAYVPATPSASIGIAGACTGDFYSVSCQSAAAATADSSFENTNIGTGAANCVRPYNVNYLFTPYHPYDNCTGGYPARDLGVITSTCAVKAASTFNATPSGAGNCLTPDDNDVWFKFIKPAGTSSLIIKTIPATCQSVTGTSVEVYSACGGAVLGCSTTSAANANFGEVSLTRPGCVAETLWVRVTADGDVPGKFMICVNDVGGNGATCSSSRVICSLPYNQVGLTTTGSGDDYDSTTAVCHTIAMNGEDYVFSYTPAATQCIQITVNSTGVNPGVFLFSGCPDSTSGVPTYCMGSSEAATGTVQINSASLTAGQTYYIIVDNNGTGGIPFDINVTGTGSAPPYDVCTFALNLGSIPNTVICASSIATHTTSCSTPTPVGQAGVPNCIPASIPAAFVNGVTNDVWMKFTAGFTGSLQINTFQSATNATANAAMAVYTGTCGSMGAPYACDNNSGPNGMPSLSIPVLNGTTYYIRVWSENPENEGNFDLCFQGNCAPANDFPCQSVLIPLGGTASGFNTCASGVAEPANAAQCVTGGTINSVWYKVVVPASGSIRVRTHPLTLTDTQIQGYLFPTGCANSIASNVNKGCNDDGVPCDAGYFDFSEQLFSGMLPGDTLFIALDGVGSLTGSFEISVIDGTSALGFPAVTPQDCAAAQIVCSTNQISVADPGWRNNGNICDLPGGTNSCWGVGERNSVWYQFSVDPALSGGTATLTFDILSASSTDLDILVWDITGLSNYCAQIQAKTLGAVACNYAAQNNATGLTTVMPPPYGYSNAITFSGAPRTYMLLINCYNSAANAGYTLGWGNSPIATTATTATWTGTTDTLYTTTTNWGDCGSTPSCAVDAIINNPPNGRIPNVNPGLPAKSVKNITINAGATLHIRAGATLNVCGNFTNLGTLICDPTSTIQFIGSGLQTISGTLNSPNSFANLVINKPSGSVQLLTNIDVAENFTISNNNTSIFNINGKYMKVAGNFTNHNGTTTFTGFGASTVEFNGSGNQFFVNTLGSITLNRVKANKTGGRIYLSGANSTMNIDSGLILTSGIIYTRNLPALEVNMRHFLPAAITGHNINSYIDGNLRRRISNPAGPSSPPIPASYDFPVGDSLTPGGYENVNVNFTSSTLVPDLLAYFTWWPAHPNPPNPGPVASECVYATYSNLPIFNNGYWTLKRSTSTFGGNYDLTLNNTGVTNNTGSGWTVAKAQLLASPGLSSSWYLSGSCFIGSTAAATKRTSMNTPAKDTTSFNALYSTVQSNQPLPIELLYFTAEPDGEVVLCKWETASETNNEYFHVERSTDGNEFIEIGSVKGFGQGTSTQNQYYSLVDKDLCDDIRYYRLRQTDFDGRYSYSETIALNCKGKSGLEVFPNPANSGLTCRFIQSETKELSINIVDITGRLVYSENYIGKKGVNQVYLKIEELSSGAYFLRIHNKDNSLELKSQFFKN